MINRFGGAGIQVDSSQNLIEGNFLGTDPTGTVGRGNTFDGILLNDASNNRIIGNVVSDNGINQDAAGINLEANDSNNIIAGNEIGTNAAGDAALGNSLHGIFLGNGSNNNTIGGPTDNDRNVISGNGKFPVADLTTQGGVEVYIFGANTSGNVVQGNYIGTNAAGTAALDQLGHRGADQPVPAEHRAGQCHFGQPVDRARDRGCAVRWDGQRQSSSRAT